MWKNKDPKPCPDCDEYGCKGRCCHYCGNIPEDILKSYPKYDPIHKLNKWEVGKTNYFFQKRLFLVNYQTKR